jgi:ABC-type molybdenum transport system ATPase subunit/photorepair protein PhrA
MGNIGAGKSTVAKMLEAEGWSRIVIDDFRNQRTLAVTTDRSSVGSVGGVFENEYLARNGMLAALRNAKVDFVYETTTANLIHAKAMLAIEAKKCRVVRVMLIVSEAESKRRIDARGVASPFAKPHEESFAYMNEALKKEWADAIFDTEMMEECVIFDKIKELL